MRGTEILVRPSPLASRELPSNEHIARAARRVRERWPHLTPRPKDDDREALAMEMLLRVSKWNWEKCKKRRVTTAAFAVFDAERRGRPDLAPVRSFYVDEILATEDRDFLGDMLQVYLECFEPGTKHTRALSEALRARATDLTDRHAELLTEFPVFDLAEAPKAFARAMMRSPEPYKHLRKVGIEAPHRAGITLAAHTEFLRTIGPKLREREEIDRLFAWLCPTDFRVMQQGGREAVECLLRAWGDKTPPEDLRADLSERIISAYNDPRTHNGGIWTGFSSELRAILLRWLTKQDMLFFCDVVTHTQPNHMWAPRRDFWLSLYEDGRIDEAWVAFGSAARNYARDNLMRTGASDINRRFGRQHDRGSGTSLLIMRIGRKIVVDGCHSYKTHIFSMNEPSAPELYGRDYYCDTIRLKSHLSRPHHPIRAWEDWVLRNV